MFRCCEDNTYIIVIVIYRSDIWSWIMTLLLRRTLTFFDSFDRCLRTMRLWSTLWIGYYSGRKTSAIQLYLADLHWQCRTAHSILHWSLKLWDAISMWKGDLKKERYVLIMFCIQKKVVQILCVNHFILEKLASKLTNGLVIHVWMRTSLIWELLEVFRCFWIHLVKSESCRFVAAGIVSTNLYLKNLRFVNWKPGIELTSWDIGSKDWVRSSFNEQELLCHITWHKTDQQRELCLLFVSCSVSCFVFCFRCLFVVFCFPVTDHVASGAKRRSLTSACGSRGWNSFLDTTVL